MSGAIYEWAADLWRTMRADYQHLLDAEFARAHEATRGTMLSRKGRAADTDPRDLWTIPEGRARQLASEELCTWWDLHGRTTLTAYEAGWLDGHRYSEGVAYAG